MREAPKGAKRPKPLCGDPATAALTLAAPFKPLREKYSAPGSSFAPRRLPCNLNNPAFEGWPSLLKGSSHAVRVETTNENASRPSAPLTLTLQGQLRMCHESDVISNNYFTSSRCYSDNRFDRNWHKYCRMRDI